MEDTVQEREKAQTLDRIAVIEERILSLKRNGMVTSVVSFCVFAGLSFWAWQDISVACLVGVSPVFFVVLAYEQMKLLVYQELDEIVFTYLGDRENLAHELALRRKPSSMMARRRHYYG